MRQPRLAPQVPVLDRIEFFDRQNPGPQTPETELLVETWFAVILTGNSPSYLELVS